MESQSSIVVLQNDYTMSTRNLGSSGKCSHVLQSFCYNVKVNCGVAAQVDQFHVSRYPRCCSCGCKADILLTACLWMQPQLCTKLTTNVLGMYIKITWKQADSSVSVSQHSPVLWCPESNRLAADHDLSLLGTNLISCCVVRTLKYDQSIQWNLSSACGDAVRFSTLVLSTGNKRLTRSWTSDVRSWV